MHSPLTPTRTRSHLRTYSRTHALTFTPTLTRTRTLTRADLLTHSLTFFFTHALTHSRTHAPTHQLTYLASSSLTYSHSWFHPPTHSFPRTHLATHSHIPRLTPLGAHRAHHSSSPSSSASSFFPTAHSHPQLTPPPLVLPTPRPSPWPSLLPTSLQSCLTLPREERNWRIIVGSFLSNSHGPRRLPPFGFLILDGSSSGCSKHVYKSLFSHAPQRGSAVGVIIRQLPTESTWAPKATLRVSSSGRGPRRDPRNTFTNRFSLMLPREGTQLALSFGNYLRNSRGTLRPPRSESNSWMGFVQDLRNVVKNRRSVILPREGTRVAIWQLPT